ncbi:MAG TPA: dihydrofolate reductase [Roseiarcus sp.]|nr:dihydrofolate reductase [Roseiarcus sp.]
MRGPFRIVAYAIASVDGMIADETGAMPKSLDLEADQRFFEKGLDHAAVLAHGRMSQENQPNSPKRSRLILTRKVAGLAPDPENPNARLWNPAGASLEEACASVGCLAGTLAALGGPEVYSFFLKIGYDDFYLSLANKVRLPGGVPLFGRGRLSSPEEIMSAAGLKAGPIQRLDDEVSLVEWTP